MIVSSLLRKLKFVKCVSILTASRRSILARTFLQSQTLVEMDSEQSEHSDPSLSSFVKEEEISRGKWLSLNEITYKDPKQRERKWEMVKRTTRVSGAADAVGIIAILKRMLKYDCIVLVKQYRPPLMCCTIEFPAGLIDPNEGPEKCAARELLEETGYTAQIKHVSPGTGLDPGVGNTTVQLVTAEIDGDLECNKCPKQSLEDTECIEVIHVPLHELLEKLNEFDAAGINIDSRVYGYAIGIEQTRKVKHIFPDTT